MPIRGMVAAALSTPSTSDVIALGAIALAVIGAVIAYRQLKAGQAQITAAKDQIAAAKDQLQEGRNTARAQFLLNMDQAFEADREIRVRLAKQNQPRLTTDEWRQVKRYMARFERVSVFISEGLLDAAVVYRLYGARFRNIVKNKQIRTRLLEGDNAASWVDFIKLWQELDQMELNASRSHLCPDVRPPTIARPAGAGTEEFEDEDSAASQ